MAIVPISRDTAHQTNLPPARPRIRCRPAPSAAPSPAPEPPETEVADADDTQPCAANPGYAVGYGKPPRHAQFRPGQSGNPRGRPKAAKGLKSIVRNTLTQKVMVRTANGTRKIPRIEAVLQKTVEQAMKGNPRALAELIKLYANAVPDERQDIEHSASIDDLTETDLAILEAYRTSMMSGETDNDPA